MTPPLTLRQQYGLALALVIGLHVALVGGVRALLALNDYIHAIP